MSKVTVTRKLITITIECETQEDIKAVYLLGSTDGTSRDAILRNASTPVKRAAFFDLLDSLYQATKAHIILE